MNAELMICLKNCCRIKKKISAAFFSEHTEVQEILCCTKQRFHKKLYTENEGYYCSVPWCYHSQPSKYQLNLWQSWCRMFADWLLPVSSLPVIGSYVISIMISVSVCDSDTHSAAFHLIGWILLQRLLAESRRTST